MTHFTPYALSGWLIGIFSLIFGLFVLIQGPNRRLARIWFLFNLSLCGLGGTIAWIGSTLNPVQSLFAWRLAYYISIPWIAPIFYHFVVEFLGLRRRRSIVIHYAISVAFLPFVHSSLFFTPVHWFRHAFYIPNAGPLFHVFVSWWISLVVYAHVLLIRSYRHVSDLKKSQIRYFLFATVLGFGGGNFGYLMHFGFDVYPWGAYAVAIYPFIMFLAIVKYQMWDIIVRKTLIYSMLTAALTTIYVALLFLITAVLRRWVGSPSAYSSAVAACAIAILSHPLLRWIQRWVDQFFPRESFSPALLREATSGFVHEIKRPLANITVPAELALMDLRQVLAGTKRPEELEKVAEKLQYIMDQSTEAARKIEAIRNLWDTSPASREKIDFEILIQRVLATQESSFEKIGAKVDLKIEKNITHVLGDPKQLEIVVMNLLKNAGEALELLPERHEKKVVVSLSQRNKQLELRVKDTGPGIRREDFSKLFLPYFSTKGSKGMGVGLYLAREIVQAHGGSLEVESSLGQGAEFVVKLPAA